MNELTGTLALIRFVVRRDRVRIAVWVGVVLLLVVVTAASTKGLYHSQAELDEAAAVSKDSPVAIAFNGPPLALATMGGQIAFQIGATTLTFVGLMTLLLMTRWTRGEEESGRLELVRSMPVGRHAPMAAALVVVVAMNAAIGAVTALSLLALDLPAGGSFALGLSFLAVGLVFAAVTAVTSQVSENARVAGGLAGAVLGASFVLRAVGDIGNGVVSWLSPVGWSQKLRPFAGESWWTLAVPLASTAVMAVLAGRLASRRDFGGGLVAPRPGRARASARLGTPLGLAVRHERATVFWWSLGVLVMGVAYGSLTNTIEDYVKDNQSLRDLIARSGAASLTDAFLGTSVLILALVAGGFAVQAALRASGEESARRTEAVLATPLSRWRWLGSNVAVAAAGSVVVLVAGGLGIGISAAVVTGDAGHVPRLVGASLVYLPAMWVIVALAVTSYGLVPRVGVALWGVLGACFVIGFFKQLLRLPGWVADLSPFEHTPRLPAAGFDVVPVAALLAVAVACAAAGFAGFRHRDLSTESSW